MAITNITGNNNQSGGQTVTPLNWGLFNRQMYSGNTKGLEVTQTTTPSMAVSVSTGLALLDYQTISSVQATILTPKTVAISTANTSNPRIDTVVIYEDTSVTMPTAEPFSADAGNGRFKIRTIDGTPAASPVALSDAAIQSTIGAGLAWTRLADVRVNANVTSIINSNITPRHTELSPHISDGAVTTGKINFTPQTYSNSGSGSGGGTGRYINFGGFKVCWGITNTAISTQNAGGMSIALPSGFFSNLDSVHVSKFAPSNDSFSVAIEGSTTSNSLNLYRSAVGTSSSSKFSWLVYGR